MEKTLEMLNELNNIREFPRVTRPRTPEEEKAWQNRLDSQRRTLEATALAPSHVKLTAFDQDHDALIIVEFDAFPLNCTTTEDGKNTVTLYSNGCTLTVRKAGQ